jgi:predicted transcriptional regulator/transcriptional regulator with XRE-family HTH domain
MVQSLVGSRIKERREALGMKQAVAARSAGISPSYLNLIEHNRRRIGGKVLLNIAAVLDVAPSSLTEGAETDLVQSLQKAASIASSEVELARVEEMVGRFPGWSRHLAALQNNCTKLERDLERLNDRLTHDPFLSESLHDILSNVTAIHATAGILKDVPDIDADQQLKFLSNLHSESQRLSNTSQSLVTYFDRKPETLNAPSTPLDEFESFLSVNNFFFGDVETDNTDAIELIVDGAAELASNASKTLAHKFLEQYRQDAKILPRDAFQEMAAQLHFAPDKLADHFECILPSVFRRLAFLPPQASGSDREIEFGLITCDISGAVTLRKPLTGFSLPRYGAACPIWPLYQSIVQPGVPIKVILNTPDEVNFLSYGLCQRIGIGGFGAPQQLEASMLITLAQPGDTGQIVPVGLNCRICSRQNCASRREPSVIETAK